MVRRKICVVTGTRAEYGLLYWLLREISSDDALELQLVATGMHLAPEFGLTYKAIEQDGFKLAHKVEMLLSSDTEVGVAKAIGLGVIGFADAFAALQPDLVVVLGDRFEILAAAQAALVARIPIAHIAGGEATEGAIDEAIRHALTKMAQIHFVTAEPYRKRVIQLGENPARVFNFGHPGLENITRLKLLSLQELETELNFALGALYFLVTYHPVTLSAADPGDALHQLFVALDSFPAAKVLITKPNADSGGRSLIELIDNYAATRPNRVYASTSLGQLRYLSAMQQCSVVIGNSSSGITEAPALHKPTVNIGDRQKGRLQAASIIDCQENSAAITHAIQTALTEEFQTTVREVEPVYSSGNTASQIKHYLKTVDLGNIVFKSFYDLT